MFTSNNIEAVTREQHQDRLRRLAQQQLAVEATSVRKGAGWWQQLKVRWTGSASTQATPSPAATQLADKAA